MLKLELLETSGIGVALHGMRLSFNSHSDSTLFFNNPNAKVGKKDFKLATRLIKEGDSASKFLRMIIAYLKITGPRYWWQEFDTYRIGVEKLSESTMHTILKHKLNNSNFSVDIPKEILDLLNTYIEEKKWEKVKQMLPESFLQERIVMLSYQSLRHIYHDRKSHRLKEWIYFCEWIKNKIPYSEFIII